VPEEQWKQQLLDRIQRQQQQQGDGQPKIWITSAFNVLSYFQCMYVHDWFIFLSGGCYAPGERHCIGCQTRPYDGQYLSLHQSQLMQLNTVDLS
jgi:hypothetical protein